MSEARSLTALIRRASSAACSRVLRPPPRASRPRWASALASRVISRDFPRRGRNYSAPSCSTRPAATRQHRVVQQFLTRPPLCHRRHRYNRRRSTSALAGTRFDPAAASPRGESCWQPAHFSSPHYPVSVSAAAISTARGTSRAATGQRPGDSQRTAVCRGGPPPCAATGSSPGTAGPDHRHRLPGGGLIAGAPQPADAHPQRAIGDRRRQHFAAEPARRVGHRGHRVTGPSRPTGSQPGVQPRTLNDQPTGMLACADDDLAVADEPGVHPRARHNGSPAAPPHRSAASHRLASLPLPPQRLRPIPAALLGHRLLIVHRAASHHRRGSGPDRPAAARW